MFGISAFSETPFASLSSVLNNRIQYASNGVYSYSGQNSNQIRTRILNVNNGVYAYIGISAIVNYSSKILGTSGTYTIVAQSSINKLFLGDWELEFNTSDIWVDEPNTASTWATEVPPTTTWN
jgi:hypothetical protein